MPFNISIQIFPIWKLIRFSINSQYYSSELLLFLSVYRRFSHYNISENRHVDFDSNITGVIVFCGIVFTTWFIQFSNRNIDVTNQKYRAKYVRPSVSRRSSVYSWPLKFYRFVIYISERDGLQATFCDVIAFLLLTLIRKLSCSAYANILSSTLLVGSLMSSKFSVETWLQKRIGDNYISRDPMLSRDISLVVA